KYDMHRQFAGIARKFFKLQELKLRGKRGIVHFKSPYDFLIRYYIMDNSIGLKYNISLRIAGFESPAAMFSVFQFQHVGSHPLFHDFRFYIRSEKQRYW